MDKHTVAEAKKSSIQDRVFRAIVEGYDRQRDIVKTIGLDTNQVKKALQNLKAKDEIEQDTKDRWRPKDEEHRTLVPIFQLTSNRENKNLEISSASKTDSIYKLLSKSHTLRFIPRAVRDLFVSRYGTEWGIVASWMTTVYPDDPQIPHKLFQFATLEGQVAVGVGSDVPNNSRTLANEPCPFLYNLGDYAKGRRCKTLEWVEHSEEVYWDFALLEESDLVEVFTGLPRELFPQDDVRSPIAAVEEFRQYLNALPLPDFPDARMETVKLLTMDLFRDEPDKLIHHLSILNSVREVRYNSATNSVRLFARGTSLQTLKGDLRNALFEGSIQLDLRAAQFAIISELWGVNLQSYIDAGIWSKIMTETKCFNKGALKTLTYRILYGSQKGRCVYDLICKEGLTRAEANRIIGSPFFQQLFKIRDEQLRLAMTVGHVEDAFGNVLTVTTMREARSALAAQAQSYELKLMLPAICYIISNQIPVSVWLHDGFIIPVEFKAHAPILEALVATEAQGLGIDTCLVSETL